jgi:predicted Rossmann fold flavoprotein
MSSVEQFDLVVIGGGPSGMVSAGRAGKLGHSVLLLEKNLSLGRKLLLTGGGRCNITNHKPTPQLMIEKYKGSEKYLHSAFAQFGVNDTMELFNRLGVQTKEEAEGRIFPMSDSSRSVLQALMRYMREGNVKIRTNANVADVIINGETKLFHIKLKDESEIIAKSCIISTGGVSHKETGSTGDGFRWLKKLGHNIINNNMALVPVALKDDWVKKLSGVKLENIKLTTFQNGKKQKSQEGKILFTHFGVTGPTILNMSKGIGELLQYGDVVVMLDLFPGTDHLEVKKRLQELLVAESNKQLKNSLAQLVPLSFVSAILEIGKISGDKVNNSVSHEERIKIVALIKAIPLNVSGLLGASKAIVSSGGVDPKEVNFRTMGSRIVPNLFVTGDVLNIDRPSGGYSLQLCWTTGFVAGSNINK